MNPFERERPGRLLEALAEDHLAVEAAVDLVVHVLDAGPVEQRRDPVEDPAGVDLEDRLVRAESPAASTAAKIVAQTVIGSLPP